MAEGGWGKGGTVPSPGGGLGLHNRTFSSWASREQPGVPAEQGKGRTLGGPPLR